MKKSFLGLLMACVIAGACAAPQGMTTSAEIAARSDQWEAALNSGDIEALVAMYGEDIQLLPPDAGMMQGKDAVRAVFGEMMGAGLGGELTAVETMQMGDIGYNLGNFTLTIPDGTVVGSGKFIELWRKIDGEWMIVRDIWNMNAPSRTQVVTVTHEVKDVDHWLAAWTGPDSRKDLFMQHGASDVRVFTSLDDSKRVGLVIGVEDQEALMAMISSPEGQAAAKEDGVVVESIQFMNEVQ